MIWTLTGVAGPTKSLFGVNVIVLLVLFNSYLPCWGIVTLVTSCPSPSNNVRVVASSSTLSPFGPSWLPLLKLTVLVSMSGVFKEIGEVCGLPCTPLVVDASACGVIGITVGEYVALISDVAGCPSLSCPSTRSNETIAGIGVPVKSFFGVNVTSPVNGLMVYVPILLLLLSSASTVVAPVTSFVLGSTNLAGFVAVGVAGLLFHSPLNTGVPDCERPCKLLLDAFSDLPITTTLGIYNPSILVLVFLFIQPVVASFVSCLRIVIPCASPTKPSSGVNCTSTSLLFAASVIL